MGNIFKGSEIVELGIQIEKNGRDFYNALAGQAGNKKAKEMFKYLAGEEEKHMAVFQGILEKLSRYEPAESYPGEYLAYMTALAGECVFTHKGKGEEIAKSMGGERQAIDSGIGIEKDSIVFYVGMKEVVPKGDHGEIDGLIAQEQEHLRQLAGLRSMVKG